MQKQASRINGWLRRDAYRDSLEGNLIRRELTLSQFKMTPAFFAHKNVLYSMGMPKFAEQLELQVKENVITESTSRVLFKRVLTGVALSSMELVNSVPDTLYKIAQKPRVGFERYASSAPMFAGIKVELVDRKTKAKVSVLVGLYGCGIRIDKAKVGRKLARRQP